MCFWFIFTQREKKSKKWNFVFFFSSCDWFFDREIDWFVCNVEKLETSRNRWMASSQSVDHAHWQPMKRWRNTIETKWIQQQQQWRVWRTLIEPHTVWSLCVQLYIHILNLKQVRTCFNVNRRERAYSIGRLPHTHGDTCERMGCEDENIGYAHMWISCVRRRRSEQTQSEEFFFCSFSNEHIYKTMRSASCTEIVKSSRTLWTIVACACVCARVRSTAFNRWSCIFRSFSSAYQQNGS